MSERYFDFDFVLSMTDIRTALIVLGCAEPALESDAYWNARDRLHSPDLIIYQKDGITPYLYRWHVIPRNTFSNVYFHIQVDDDWHEEGPHDHKSDSQSIILGGAYIDRAFIVQNNKLKEWTKIQYEVGSVIRRRAKTPHYLHLAPDHKYAMTLFCTGPNYRKWGYYENDGTFKPANEDYAITGIASSALQSK